MHIHPSSPESSLFLEPEESAAIKIQAGFRGYRVRKNLYNNQQNRKAKANAYGYVPVTRQQLYQQPHHQLHNQMEQNNNNSLQNAATPHSPKDSDVGVGVGVGVGGNEDEVQQKCATKIQAGVRGFLVRKKQKIETDAATKIQAGFRGFKARKDVQKLKQK